MSQTTDTAERASNAVKDTAYKVSSAVDSVRPILTEKAQNAGRMIQEKWQDVTSSIKKTAVNDAMPAVRRTIRTKPLTTVAVGLGVGLLVGYAMSRRATAKVAAKY